MEVAKSRKQRLRACERVLAEHMEEFVKVGLALKEIRDDRLYKEDGFERFEDYCKKKWEISASRARQIVGAAEVRVKLPSVTSGNTWTERSVRELKRLPADSKAKAVAERVVKEVEATGGKLTSGLVRKHVDKELGVDRKPKPQPKPYFHDVVLSWAGTLNGIATLLQRVPDDALRLFAEEYPQRAKDLAAAIERLEKGLERVWARLP